MTLAAAQMGDWFAATSPSSGPNLARPSPTIIIPRRREPAPRAVYGNGAIPNAISATPIAYAIHAPMGEDGTTPV